MINNHIVLEGLDGTGKTTICNEIMRINGEYIYWHFSTPKGETMRDKYSFQHGSFSTLGESLNILNLTNRRALLDRSHVGEMVWGPVFRDATPLYLYDLMKEFPINVSYYMIDADNDCINSRLIDRGENPIEDSKLNFRRHLFKLAFETLQLKYTTISTSISDPRTPSDIAEEIVAGQLL